MEKRVSKTEQEDHDNMKANGAAIGEIAPAEWHGLRVVNILVDYAQMRMRLSSSERSEVEAIRRDMYRDLGLDPNKQYARRRDGKVYEVQEGQGAAGHSGYSTDRPMRPH